MYQVRLTDLETVYLQMSDDHIFGCTVSSRCAITSHRKSSASPRHYKFTAVQAFEWLKKVYVTRKSFPRKLLWHGRTVLILPDQTTNNGSLARGDRLIGCKIPLHGDEGAETTSEEGAAAVYDLFGPLSNHDRFTAFFDGIDSSGAFRRVAGMFMIAHVRLLSCHKSHDDRCGLCLEQFDLVTVKCGACENSFCDGCAKGWVLATGPTSTCPYCRADFHVPDRMTCNTCSHTTLRALYSLLHPNKPLEQFSQPAGVTAHKRKIAPHASSKMHEFSFARYPLCVGESCEPGMEATARQLCSELAQHHDDLVNRGCTVSFVALRTVPAPVDAAPEEEKQPANEALDPDEALDDADTMPTKRMLRLVYANVKAKQPASGVLRFHEMLRLTYGDLIGDQMPATHGATATSFRSVNKIVRLMSFTNHRNLIVDLHRTRNTLVGLEGQKFDMCDPSKLIFDAYSREVKGFLVMIVKCFRQCPETPVHQVIGCPSVYGIWQTVSGRLRQRDSTGQGLYNTMLKMMTDKQFLDVALEAPHPLHERVLTQQYVQQNCVEISGDAGGGMPVAMEMLHNMFDDLPPGWGESHLLESIFRAGRKSFPNGSYARKMFKSVNRIALWMRTPKRYDFVTDTCEVAGLPWVKLQHTPKNHVQQKI